MHPPLTASTVWKHGEFLGIADLVSWSLAHTKERERDRVRSGREGGGLYMSMQATSCSAKTAGSWGIDIRFT